MTVYLRSAAILAVNIAASAVLLALDAAAKIADRRKPAPQVTEPVEPVVEDMPTQRGRVLPVASIPEEERYAMARVVAGVASDEDRALVKNFFIFFDLMKEVEQ